MITRLKPLFTSEALPAAILLSGMLVFYLPLSIAVANHVFFMFSSAQFAGALAVAWIALTIVVIGIERALSGRARVTWSALIVAVGVLFWAQAWFITANFWELHWWLPSRNRISVFSGDALKAIAVIALGVSAFIWRRRETVRFLWLLNGGMAAYMMYMLATDPTRAYWVQPSDELHRFSATRNVVVVLLDAFQSDMFAEIVARYGKLGAEFDGFTFFSDATGVAASTHLAMPTIHSGRVYESGSSIKDLYQLAVKDGSFMTHLSGAGYVGIYLNPMMKSCPAGLFWCGHQATLTSGNFQAFGKEVGLLLDVAFRRVLPGFVRDSLYYDLSFDPDIHQRIAKGVEVLHDITQNMSVSDDSAPRAKFLHLMSTHAPIYLDENCNSFKGRHWVRDDMRRQATCAARRVGEFLAALKRHKIYDRSLIVLLADHGSGLPPSEGQANTPKGQKFQLVSGMAGVLLLVKPEQARGPMRISYYPADLRDIAATICTATGACQSEGGKSLLIDHTPDAARERFFMFYPWWFGKWTQDRLQVPEHYRIAGPRTDPESWQIESQKK